MNPDLASIPLRDIHLPETVSWWPLAPGWWITLGLLLLAAITVYFLKYMKERRQLEKQSLDEFSRIVDQYKSNGDATALLADISQLLRRVSITRFTETDVASLTGDAWLTFLDEPLKDNNNPQGIRFQGELGACLVAGQYQRPGKINEQKLDQVLVLTRVWLQIVCSKNPTKQLTGKTALSGGEV